MKTEAMIIVRKGSIIHVNPETHFGGMEGTCEYGEIIKVSKKNVWIRVLSDQTIEKVSHVLLKENLENGDWLIYS